MQTGPFRLLGACLAIVCVLSGACSTTDDPDPPATAAPAFPGQPPPAGPAPVGGGTGAPVATAGAAAAPATGATGGTGVSGGEVADAGAGPPAPEPEGSAVDAGAAVADASSAASPTSSAGCARGGMRSPGETSESISVGGVDRDFIAYVPRGYTGQQPVPLLVDLHPLFGSAGGHRATSGYAAVAEREGFIVLYPDGIDDAWNIGPCCTFDRGVDDVGFVRALVERLESEECIDPSRVYAAGFSMGGGMSHYLGCEAADVFAAVAPAAFDLLEENDCAPLRPVGVIAFRGTLDFIVPYAGGASNPPNGLPTTIHFRGAEGTFAEWARVNGCSGPPVDAGGGCQSYTECGDGVEVTLCTAVGGGHATGDAERGWEALSKHALP